MICGCGLEQSPRLRAEFWESDPPSLLIHRLWEQCWSDKAHPRGKPRCPDDLNSLYYSSWCTCQKIEQCARWHSPECRLPTTEATALLASCCPSGMRGIAQSAYLLTNTLVLCVRCAKARVKEDTEISDRSMCMRPVGRILVISQRLKRLVL